MKKKLYYLLFNFLIFQSCKKEVTYINPEIKSITESVYTSGIIKSDDQYEVFANVQGIIKKIMVKEGDKIKKGSPLLIIGNKNAELITENANLAASFYDISANQEKLRQIEKEIESAVRKAKSDSLLMIRQNNLWQQGIGSKTDQEQRELVYLNTKATVENFRLRYTELKKQLRFLSDQSKKSLKIASSTLSDFTVRSEIEGVVFNVLKQKGEIVNPQSAVAVIGNAQKYVMELIVDEYDITKVKIGQEVVVRLDSYQGQVFEGQITNIMPIMNEKTRSFMVEAEFTKKPPVLYPNLSIEANIVISRKLNAITIPAAYLKSENKVFLADGSEISVKTGVTDYKIIEIISGLDTSSQIILNK